jgi:hypothetical protein
MAKAFPGRYIAQIEAPFVIFVIGMRINRLWAIHRWLPTALAMGPMLRALYTHPEKGFLGAQTLLAPPRGITLVQYWRSFKHLERLRPRAGRSASVGLAALQPTLRTVSCWFHTFCWPLAPGD